MDKRPDQPPEGKLIADAADRMDLSIREAARRAGLSYGRWRQVVQGYQNTSPGQFAKVNAPAKTLAKMARVVGVTPEQMETEGQRPDVADLLRQPAPAEPSPVRELKPAVKGEPWWLPLPPGIDEEDVEPVAAGIRRDLAPLLMDLPSGEKLSGEQFPGSPVDGMAWDLLMEKDMSPAMAARYIAIAWLKNQRRARSRGGHAAGLSAVHPA